MTQTSLKPQLPTSYVLGRSDAETRRLMLQHQIYGPITRRLFEAAGIGAGMRVLDVGSGAGDVALLLAELVGPRGRVVGVDLNAAILNTARARVQAAGWQNVTFRACDAHDLPPEQQFDAIVGRWVLMHTPDPVDLLRSLALRLRPGGIIAFQDSDFTYPPTMFPPSALSAQVQRWSIPSMEAMPAAVGMTMGTRLFRTYLAAGLPAPERMTGLDPDEVQIDTLADRLRADAVSGGRVQMLPIVIGAWARTS